MPRALLPHHRGQEAADAGHSPSSFPMCNKEEQQTDNTCQDMRAPPPKVRLSWDSECL